jgi:hypothetical protein
MVWQGAQLSENMKKPSAAFAVLRGICVGTGTPPGLSETT